MADSKDDGKYFSGMTNRSPSSTDKSTTLPTSPTVDQDAVRTGTAKTPKTLGPRTA